MSKISFAGTTFKINLMKTDFDIKNMHGKKKYYETSLF